MDQSLEQIYARLNYQLLQCFNPYFSGSVTGTKNILICCCLLICFNPYFSGSVTGTQYLECIIVVRGVSILILVDQSLEHKTKWYSIDYDKCFNPYFSGSVTGTAVAVKYWGAIYKFQSLF